MIFLFCGMIIGIVMGLTGAGGALIAIPLFMQFLGMDLKEASVYSLLAVVLASSFNFIPQRKMADLKISLPVFIFSTLGSLSAVSFKQNLPNWVIVALLLIVSFYALFGVWIKSKSSSLQKILSLKKTLLLCVPVGILLGVLTTFTGLGGGVLMMPVFINIFYLSQKEAVATSLLAVFLSSLFSLIVQVYKGAHFVMDTSIVYLIIGIVIAVWLIKLLIVKLKPSQMEAIRKYVFTFVVFLALVKIIL